MFDLSEKRLVWIKVTFPGFVSTGDTLARRVEHEIEVQVDLVDGVEFARLFDNPRDQHGIKVGETPERVAEWDAENDETRSLALVHNWRGVTDGKKSLPFSPDEWSRMMQVPNFPLAFFNTYAGAWTATEETRSGNSEGSPANGPAGEPSE